MLRAVIAIAPLLISCIEPYEPGAPTPARSSTLDEEIVRTLARADYHSFTEISAAPYASELGPFDIAVWANFAPLYAMIAPERDGSHVHMPPDTIIVREVLDANGDVETLTLTAKGPPGFDPRIGDWWFGVTDPAGRPRVVDGVVQLGRMTECHGCHLPRADDDYLFGVPRQGR